MVAGRLTRSRPVRARRPYDSLIRGFPDAVAQQLRANGVPTEVAASPQKFGKQIRYAERRGIPYVWFLPGSTRSSDHEVKDIRSGDQVAADPASWTPPVGDLTPRVVSRVSTD